MTKNETELLLSELIRYRSIYLQEKKEKAEGKEIPVDFLTTIDCHIEDLIILLEDFEPTTN